jgi:hypothetical protein
LKKYYRIFEKKQEIGSIIKINEQKRSKYWKQNRIEGEALMEKLKPAGYPSRLKCFFVFDNTYDLEKFLEHDWKNNFKNHFMYELEAFPTSKIVKLDANWITYIWGQIGPDEEHTKNIEKFIKQYWNGEALEEEEPIFEVLFEGKAKILRQL